MALYLSTILLAVGDLKVEKKVTNISQIKCSLWLEILKMVVTSFFNTGLVLLPQIDVICLSSYKISYTFI